MTLVRVLLYASGRIADLAESGFVKLARAAVNDEQPVRLAWVHLSFMTKPLSWPAARRSFRTRAYPGS